MNDFGIIDKKHDLVEVQAQIDRLASRTHTSQRTIEFQKTIVVLD